MFIVTVNVSISFHQMFPLLLSYYYLLSNLWSFIEIDNYSDLVFIIFDLKKFHSLNKIFTVLILNRATVKLSNIWLRRTVPYRTIFLIVYNFVYKHSVYFLVVDNYRLQYLLQKLYHLIMFWMFINKVVDHRKQFGSASLRRNQKFESFTVSKEI